jgi:hypothetical protein
MLPKLVSHIFKKMSIPPAIRLLQTGLYWRKRESQPPFLKPPQGGQPQHKPPLGYVVPPEAARILNPPTSRLRIDLKSV